MIVQFTTADELSDDVEVGLVLQKLENAHDMWVISAVEHMEFLLL